jgi:hypothetical protein
MKLPEAVLITLKEKWESPQAVERRALIRSAPYVAVALVFVGVDAVIEQVQKRLPGNKKST